MFDELKAVFEAAAVRYPATDGKCMAMVIWGYSVAEILKLVVDKALGLGREYRPEIEAAAKSAVDSVVAMNLPLIPDDIEGTIDEATRNLGYLAIEKVLDAVLAN
jgi:hypothetical protein